MQDRSDIINFLAKENGAMSYHEIGVQRGRNFVKVDIQKKISVDPEPDGGLGRSRTTHKMTSDDFFSQNNQKFDIIFIDGLHHADQVHKDILNSLKFLNRGGYIVCHDMNPIGEIYQRVPRETRSWYGDCWKAWVKLRQERSNLEMFVVDIDCGCGVISAGKQELIYLNESISYKGLDKSRKEWLNLISVEDFVHRFNLP